ncbi:MAG: cellulase family glycosylhydrolase [Bacteroidales bacterium]
MKKLLIISIVLLIGMAAFSQAPFHKGVNLTNWFQSTGAHNIQFRKFTKKDFADIKSLGCDVIRLPINLHGMTLGAPDYIIDPLLFTFLDSTILWAEELNIHLLIDNHSFDPSTNTSPNVGEILTRVWPQIAERYQSRSDLIYYEVLNEPHGISNALWGSIQKQTIDAIRAVDTKHTIIVGPSGYNSYNDLAQMPVYSDTNLLYTFHFYDPFLFTHQGNNWTTPSMEALAGVPFPYDAVSMPACPPSLVGTWVESSMNNYPNDGTVAKVKSLINIAVNFRNSRNINIFCGEFGVYIPNSDNADRVYWYQVVKDYLEEKNIPWTIWDYKGGFGLFDKGSNEFFENDLNTPLLEALDMLVPPQSPFVQLPDSVGFILYDDFFGKGINEASWAPDQLDYYSELFPNNDQFCIFVADGPQYRSVAFDFVPNRDLSQLVDQDYALDFFVRGNKADIKLDMRFLDTKTGATDHPWRMRTTLSSSTTSFDKRWHHLHIPLSNFSEHGSWDNNTWYEPQGLFDWTAIDRFEIVAEYSSLDGQQIWFDNMMITQLDTAHVHETGTLGIEALLPEANKLTAWPNPFGGEVMIGFENSEKSLVRIGIYTLANQQIAEILNQEMPAGYISVRWDGRDRTGRRVAKGIYLCRISTGCSSRTLKLVFAGN